MFEFAQRSGARAPLHGYDLTTFKYFPPWPFSLYIWGLDENVPRRLSCTILFSFCSPWPGRTARARVRCSALMISLSRVDLAGVDFSMEM